LNRSYKIPGYRITITKRGTDQEELQLKKDYYAGTKLAKVESNNNECLMKLLEEVKILTQRIDNIEHFLSQE
jgi:tRNA A22 N-methylase